MIDVIDGNAAVVNARMSSPVPGGTMTSAVVVLVASL